VSDLKEQGRHWSRHAERYGEVFLDPFREEVENPWLRTIEEFPGAPTKAVIDLGCGTGPLLPRLLDRFGTVYALDFAPGMIKKARARLGGDADRVRFLARPMDDLAELAGCVDVAVAVNSLVMPDVRAIDRTLHAIRATLRRGGLLVGVVPAMDAIHYHTMLLMDQALDRGMPPEEAERHAAFQAEHSYYDFGFGRFAYQGLRQKFWQPFEVEYRLKKAGFGSVTLDRVLYPWDDSVYGGAEFADQPRSWDWSFVAKP
jgi:SAM-dependent methyltransferase